MKYTAHIISHSHLDREWYLPFEQHNMRLIELIDSVLDAIDNDGDFKSFHLDGQSIPLEDYLKVKPQNEAKLRAAVSSGKIKAGPWYVLQDAYLTSSEANIRNMQIGQKIAKDFGSNEFVGYYPDTFGIYGQVSQIMKNAGIDSVFFGRGVSPTGFNNEVSNDFESKYSEMILQAPDGSETLGVLFANWYSNGNEIPVEKAEAKKYWDRKLSDAKQFTPSNHLLFMNGCDHQPYQKSVTEAIKVANELYDDIEFKQSSITEYLKALELSLEDTKLTTINGELKSQNTDGYYTLVNTASARIYQKQKNVLCQDYFEKYAEPLSTMLRKPENYPHDLIEYGWKKLIENHPHDSICGCSHDSVHRSMDVRFEDSLEVAKFITSEALNEFASNTSKIGETSFAVINPLSIINNNVIKVEIDYKRQDFSVEGYEKALSNMQVIKIPNLVLQDENGCEIPAIITDLGSMFDYDLPKDKFRIPYYARRLSLEFTPETMPFSVKKFKLVEENNNVDTVSDDFNGIRNNKFEICLTNNNTIDVVDKETDRVYKNVFRLIDEGDIGNEYMFGKVHGITPIDISAYNTTSSIVKTNVYEQINMEIIAQLPISADESTFMDEKVSLVEFYKRNTKRSSKLVDVTFNVEIRLDKLSDHIDFTVNFDNKVKDHRVRAIFNCGFRNEFTYADSIFEVAKRPIVPSKFWKHEQNDHQQTKFVALKKDNSVFCISNYGLPEYEAISESEVAITLVRGVSEMGDWGHFETPEAQCLRNFSCKLAIYIGNNENEIYNNARNYNIAPMYKQLIEEEGINHPNIDIKFDNSFCITSVKRNESNCIIVRGFGNSEGKLGSEKGLIKTNILENDNFETSNDISYKENEIITVKTQMR